MGSRHRVYSAEGAGALTTRFRSLANPPGRILKRYIHIGDTVLDFGCGPGFFTLPMAQMVGESGRVIAVDLQDEMLSILRKRADDAGLSGRIRFHVSLPDSLALADCPPVAFILAYHVLHETESRERITEELSGILQKSVLLLIVEPSFIVSRSEFRQTVKHAVNAGLTVTGSPCVLLSRTALLRKS